MSKVVVMNYRLIVAGRRRSLRVPANYRLAACDSQSWRDGLLPLLPFAQASDVINPVRMRTRAKSRPGFGVSFCMRGLITRSTPGGHDALKPLSKTPHDWYGQSLLMTPVDALDTLILMKLDEEAAKAKELILTDLSFDRDVYVKNFEITIRLLGGLLSSYQLTNDKRLLDLAEDLGNRLLPVFQFADRTSLRLCQSENRPGSRYENEPR